MTGDEYKKYTLQARRGIKGEAFFESLVCEYSIPHHVVGPKDVGIDYFCEWVHGDRPTGVLYAVQVKTFSEKTAKPKFVCIEKKLNGLEKYKIHNSNLKVEEKTRRYWQGLGIPVYLFAVVLSATDDGEEQLDCYYKRFTPILTEDRPWDEYVYYADFYKVNEGDSFIAFKLPGALGFARDLFFDLVRQCYYKGSIAFPDPCSLGLEQFGEPDVFVGLFRSYKERLCATYSKTTAILKALGYL